MPVKHKRAAGVLMHLTSLPGPGPLGTMGAQARDFIDFLQASGQKIWQMLPLTPPARGNSPYSALSVFAGNPLLIGLRDLEECGLLPKGSLPEGNFPAGRSDFATGESLTMPLLRSCFAHSRRRLAVQLEDFRARQSFWLEDYALFMALRARYGGADHHDWPPTLLHRDRQALQKAGDELRDEVDFWVFVQYLFFSQWAELREYANSRGVRIFGDVPIYVDRESADVWAHGEIFLLDQNLLPRLVAGVPPDDFSEDGQLWDNPLYDWDAMRDSGFAWWTQRLRAASLMYDMIRIDHFRALESYWAIPAGEKSAKNGRWLKGPGMAFFDAVREKLPDCDLVAEDLGLLTDDVRNLLRQSGLPGLVVLQFAFDPQERSLYLPHFMQRNRVAYIGTHDNDTAVGWLRHAPPEQAAFARSYMNLSGQEGEHWGFVRTLYASVAETAIVQTQDLLGLGSEARMNVPARKEGNWSWRLPPGLLTDELAGHLRKLAWLYDR